MPGPGTGRLSLTVLCLLLLCSASELFAAKIFVVHSYHPEYLWTQEINEGIREGLRGLGVEFEYFYLDAMRKQDRKELSKAGAALFERVKTEKPDLLISVDDAAQANLVEPYLKGLASPQVIFCGVNAPPAMYGFPASNVSGVRERWHFREGFALLKRIVPSARNISILVDNSDSASYVIDDLRQDEAQNGPFALDIELVKKIGTLKEWKKTVVTQMVRSDVISFGLYHSIKDEQGDAVPPEAIAQWDYSVTSKPSLGFTIYAMKDGNLAGVLESGHEQGFLAGQMAREVLSQGVAAGSLPVRVNQKGIVFLNLKTAERLGLSIPFEIIEAAEILVK